MPNLFMLPCFFYLRDKYFGQKKYFKLSTSTISIDGKINEDIWKTASVATDFVMFEPDNGKPIPNDKKTEVKIVYDNNAIYISALLYDNEQIKFKRNNQ
jgi:hypothetical protein